MTIVVIVALGAIGYGIMHKTSGEGAMQKDAMMVKDQMQKDIMMQQEGGASTSDNEMMKKDTPDTTMKMGKTMPHTDTMMAKDEMMKKDTMMAKGVYEIYSPEKVMQATGKIVLFFNASWCPTCRALDKELKANTAKIPAGTTILSVDYDTSTELKKKYGVTTQHTLVQVDKTGNKINTWKGGNLDTIIANTQ